MWTENPFMNTSFMNSKLQKISKISEFSQILKERICICSFSSSYDSEQSLVDIFDKNKKLIATYRFKNEKIYDPHLTKYVERKGTSHKMWPKFDLSIDFRSLLNSEKPFGFSETRYRCAWDVEFNEHWEIHRRVFELFFENTEIEEYGWTFMEFILVLFHALSFDSRLIYMVASVQANEG